MVSMLKTKDVSERLGVHPATVQRWVRHFNIHCQTNDNGHYLFVEQHVEILKHIKDQLQQGRKLKEVTLEADAIVSVASSDKQTEKVPKVDYEKRLEQLMLQIEQLERKLSDKADSVVSFQVLQHRTEIDEMMQMLKKIEDRVQSIEMNVLRKKQPSPNIEEIHQPKKKSLLSMFSF